MKLQVLVGGPGALAAAGTRIRYRRLMPALARLGVELTVEPLDRLTLGGASGPVDGAAADVLLLSKVHDARSLVLARQLRGVRGVRPLLGIDLFDDYFSQVERSGLSGQRRWLAAIAADLDFTLCSTKVMADAVEPALGDTPLHVLADPIGAPPPEAAWLAQRQRRQLGGTELNLLWFGMGDNPHFAVGLEDLTAQADHLRALAAAGRDLRLTVLTNRRALTADGLTRLAGLPLTTRVEEWSEALETQRLREADVAVLPVRRDAFSRAKSPNRVLAALLEGCQVLCPGRPDSWSLAPFTYNQGTELARDLARGQLRWGPHSRERLTTLVAATADPSLEAARLKAFLRDLAPRPAMPEATGPSVVVVGSAIEVADLTALGRLPCLIVASPVAPRHLQGDLWFEPGPPGTGPAGASGEALVGLSARLVQRLAPGLRDRLLAPGAEALGAGRWRLPFLELAQRLGLAQAAALQRHAAALALALRASGAIETALCTASAQAVCAWLLAALLPEARLIPAEPRAELLP